MAKLVSYYFGNIRMRNNNFLGEKTGYIFRFVKKLHT